MRFMLTYIAIEVEFDSIFVWRKLCARSPKATLLTGGAALPQRGNCVPPKQSW